ncbi:MAG TPA: cytochrome b/b6 domain-containing protein [Xanthobacteraceae bacterium]|nr:cytochrome b/b6 domain-containing protein [Xanthobacteraceae bacterium]
MHEPSTTAQKDDVIRHDVINSGVANPDCAKPDIAKPDVAKSAVATPDVKSLAFIAPIIIKRHSITVRLTHWFNVLCFVLLLMSGLAIFNAHPALYWGHYGYRGIPPLMGIGAMIEPTNRELIGITQIAGHNFETTGVLGVSQGSDGQPTRRAFPAWATLPSSAGLALGRDWHFLAAWLFAFNGAIYLVAGLLGGHFRRDLLPTARQLRPRHLATDLWNHIRLRMPRGEADRHYNVLQKIVYLTVVFLLLPAMILSGLTMSPAVTAAAPFLFDLFSGRQSARTIHFITANLLVLFVFVHVFQVLVAGAINQMRAMITGRYRIRAERKT